MEYLRAFADGHTYDLRNNAFVWVGALAGFAAPLFVLLLSALPSGLWPWAAAAQPVLLSLAFGAIGTVLSRRGRDSLARWKDRAMTDALTGLPNRRAGALALHAMIREARLSSRPCVVVLIDLADFKSVNDTYGHVRGDEVLREAAQALRGAFRSSDALCRFGGDEFLLLVPAGPDIAMAALIRAMETLKERTGLGVSAGMSSYPLDGDVADDLLRIADRRLIASKRQRDLAGV